MKGGFLWAVEQMKQGKKVRHGKARPIETNVKEN